MKVMTIFGTRPEGIKMAPLVKQLKNHPNMECIFVNTGQHKEMLNQVLELFDIQPDYDLELMKEHLPLSQMFSNMYEKIDTVIQKEQPDIVLVHGDTLSTAAGSLAAFYNQVKVGHVEAGLRTYDITSPYPEEANRQIVGTVANIHFASTQSNKDNLIKEGKNKNDIYVVGNSVIDALMEVIDKEFTFSEDLLPIVNSGLRTILMTTHRRENLGELKNVYRAVNRVIEEFPDVQIIFPVHKNPIVRHELSKHLKANSRVHIIEPVDYMTFSHLMNHSYFILTDSGGIQEEAPALGKPVLVARNNTERPEGIEAGTLKLCGTKEDTVYTALCDLLTNEELYQDMSGAKNPYGTGTTSKSIIDILIHKEIVELFSKTKN